MSDNRHKFRVWDKIENRYYDGDMAISQLGGLLFYSYGKYEYQNIDNFIIEQCTGLSAAKSYRGDKPEDLLVWEGDVLEWTEIRIMDGTEIKHQVYIEFRGNGFGTTHMDGKPDGMIWSPTCYEIIGNVHEVSK